MEACLIYDATEHMNKKPNWASLRSSDTASGTFEWQTPKLFTSEFSGAVTRADMDYCCGAVFLSYSSEPWAMNVVD